MSDLNASEGSVVLPILALLAIIGVFAIVCIPAGATSYLWFRSPLGSPTPTPTPVNPNVGIFWMMGTRNTVPTPFPTPALTNVQGIYFGVDWTQIEPHKNSFDWTPITTFLNGLPAGKVAQVNIATGAYSSPMVNANCTKNGFTIGTSGPNTCEPWLTQDGVDSITELSFAGPNGSNHGFDPCTTLLDPNPLNTTFQADWENMVSNVAAQFAADSRVAQIFVVPMSDKGGDLSLATSYNATGTPGSCTNTTQYTNSSWNTLAQAYGISSGDDAGWGLALTTAFGNMWSAYATDFAGKSLTLWTNTQAFPTISTTTGILPKTDAYYPMFTYAAAHPPTGNSYYVANEALQPSLSWFNAVSQVASLNNFGAQMNKGYCANSDTQCETDGSCAQLLSGVTTYGACKGATWAEIYLNDVQQCTAELPAIKAALTSRAGC